MVYTDSYFIFDLLFRISLAFGFVIFFSSWTFIPLYFPTGSPFWMDSSYYSHVYILWSPHS